MSDKNSFGQPKTFFSKKGSQSDKIKPFDGNNIWHDDSEVVEELNRLFKKSLSTLNINGNFKYHRHYRKSYKYKFHSSILLINYKIVNEEKYFF